MKVLSKSILLAIATLQLSLIPLMATPQNSYECFMLDANGNPMDLGHLCGSSQNSGDNTTLNNRKLQSSDYSSDYFVVPIKRRDGGKFGTPVIEVNFNNQYVFEMLFDTGATMTVITEPMAHILQLKPTGSLPFQTASNNLIFFDTSQISSVRTGDVVNNNFKIAISPSLNMGLLGQDFYGKYEYTVKEHTIEFRRR